MDSTLSILVKGIIVGLITCAPIGPVGLFCLRRTLTYGRTIGIVSLLGASTADGLYCTVACFGIAFVSDFLQHEQTWISLAAGLILVLLGVKIFVSEPREKAPKDKRKGLLGAYTSTFLLMLANPTPILVFTATFAALGMHGWTGNYLSTAVIVAGVFVGSACWSPILLLLGTIFRLQYDPAQIRLVNKISGAILAALGALLGLARFF